MNIEVHYFKDRRGWWRARVEWADQQKYLKTPYSHLGHALLYFAEHIPKLVGASE